MSISALLNSPRSTADASSVVRTAAELLGILDREAFLLPSEVMAITRFTEQTLANLRAQNKGPRWVRFGRSIRYPAADFREWLNDQPDGGLSSRQSA